MRSLASLPTCFGLALATACATPTSPTPSPSNDQPSTPPARATADPVEPPQNPPAADPLAAAFVEAHDRARASVSPPASPALSKVRWSDELAATARAWAQRCEFRHSQGDYGENLAARTDQADPSAVVASWAAEAQNYDHRKNRCASGEVCGHYTQLVWRGSTTIGCGVARCNGSGGPFGGDEWFMWVCNYSPPGNWQGERPY